MWEEKIQLEKLKVKNLFDNNKFDLIGNLGVVFEPASKICAWLKQTDSYKVQIHVTCLLFQTYRKLGVFSRRENTENLHPGPEKTHRDLHRILHQFDF